MKTITIEQFAKLFGVTVDQCNALKAKNRVQLKAMHAQAVKTGKKVNGYNAEQLRQLITGLQIPN